MTHSRAIGIDGQLDAEVLAARDIDGQRVGDVQTGGEARQFAADAVVHTAGRTAHLDGLKLQRARVPFGSAASRRTPLSKG